MDDGLTEVALPSSVGLDDKQIFSYRHDIPKEEQGKAQRTLIGMAEEVVEILHGKIQITSGMRRVHDCVFWIRFDTAWLATEEGRSKLKETIGITLQKEFFEDVASVLSIYGNLTWYPEKLELEVQHHLAATKQDFGIRQQVREHLMHGRFARYARRRGVLIWARM